MGLGKLSGGANWGPVDENWCAKPWPTTYPGGGREKSLVGFMFVGT